MRPDYTALYLRRHDELAHQHVLWQRTTGQFPVSYTRAYDETETAARDWFRRSEEQVTPTWLWIVHGVLIVVTLGCWAPFAALQLYISRRARSSRYGY